MASEVLATLRREGIRMNQMRCLAVVGLAVVMGTGALVLVPTHHTAGPPGQPYPCTTGVNVTCSIETAGAGE